MGVKVAKFGGSSVADAIQLAKVKSIIEADPARKYIVVSAPGKRFDGDSKITDLLYLCNTHLEHNVPCDQIFQVIVDRYMAMAISLGVNINLEQEFAEIREKLEAGEGPDYIASRGEYLNAKLTAAYLGLDFVDAAGLVQFNEKGKFLDEETDQALSEELKKHDGAVIPGFYGTMPNGKIKTFTRGGSDITGSIVAKAVDAVIYENWTDVHGFLQADPRIVKNPHPIGTISYAELRELSYMGASVLHENAIYPVRGKNIPINIRNTNDPDHPGTMIVSSAKPEDDGRVITGIAGSKDFTVIGLHKNLMSTEVGYIKRLLGILEGYNINVEHLPSGIDSVSVVISKKQLKNNLGELLDEIERKLSPDSLEVSHDIALIATVGTGMANRCGTAARLFTALAEANVNIRMIDQGSSEMNIIVGVENKDFENAIRAIYNAFVTE
ncbi:MAG: aspartate kinase [Firmicutes bacterium]|nr:aspartate kinase [Bacillota bacterium]